jgi:protein gp37
MGHQGRCQVLGVKPSLEPIRLKLKGISWIIVGGESAKKADLRDCGVEAILDVVRQCKEAGVPVFVQQDAGSKADKRGRIPEEVFRIMEYPNV